MAYARTISPAGIRAACIRELLYKADHPRRIDVFIDFFGDAAQGRARVTDRCGHILLGSLA
jgi:hypothetical protein